MSAFKRSFEDISGVISELQERDSMLIPLLYSPTTDKLDAALAKAQGEIGAASKDKKNPHFKSTYADFNSYVSAAKEVLAKHGLSITQWPVHSSDNKQHLITRIACQGEYLMAEVSCPVDKQTAQGIGSAITYLKRYAYAAVLGMQAEEDDDGNAASSHPAPQSARPLTQPFFSLDSPNHVKIMQDYLIKKNALPYFDMFSKIAVKKPAVMSSLDIAFKELEESGCML